MVSFFRKYHKWLGLFFALFLIIYSLSGIVLNHRNLFSGVEVSRNLMPDRYTYDNWNMGALRGSHTIGQDSILMYGNMGVWLADGNLENLQDFSQGLASGMDNHKVYVVYLSQAGNLYMGTLSGVFVRNTQLNQWEKIAIETHDERFLDITEKDGKIVFLARSHIYISEDKPKNLDFERILLKNPRDYDNKISLFKTIWFVHSGEIYGDWGILLVDLLGLVFIFLSIGGVIYFFIPRKIKKNYKDGKSIEKTKGFHRWNLRWHNKIGYWFIALLLVTSITGIFLRPPGLIAIAYAKVGKIPFTTLSSPSAWFDKLRAIEYDSLRGEYLVLTDEWTYSVDTSFQEIPKLFSTQPPISIMGVNTFEKTAEDSYLVGTFMGLYLWQPEKQFVLDYENQREYVPSEGYGSPFRNSSITGIVRNKNQEMFFVDYDSGIHAINKFNIPPEMPEVILSSPISLWNYALEVHTGRFFSFIFGGLYILIVPIVGLGTIFILISGFIVWWKRHRK